MYLERIDGPNDVKKLSLEQMDVLAQEMREALFRKLSKHGGHFGQTLVWSKRRLHCIPCLILQRIKWSLTFRIKVIATRC